MNKKEFGRAVAEHQGMTYQDAAWATTAIFDTLKDLMKSENKVVIHGFGTFKRVEKAPKTFRHPATGELKTRPAELTVRFVPAEVLREELNTL